VSRLLTLALLACLGCGRTVTGVESCTLARAGADTATVRGTGTAGDTIAVASVRWCLP
jgi:hypothetical protein